MNTCGRLIFDIQRFSIHDGRGIRTLIFFKGCPLRCRWCENPESQSFTPELSYDPDRCLGCLDCVKADGGKAIRFEGGELQIDRGSIRDPEIYRDLCPSGALTVIGKAMSLKEVLAEVRKDMPFYAKSTGGVTFSGGEPFAQPRFLLELCRALTELDIPLAVETSLAAPWKHIAPALPFLTQFLADLKHTDAAKFTAFTGGNLDRVLDNFRTLAEREVPLIARIPVIPGFNDTPGDLRDLVGFAARLGNVREIHFLPFHTLGAGKYALLGREYCFHKNNRPDEGMLDTCLKLAGQQGIPARIGG